MYKVIGSLKTRAFRVAWILNELGEPFVVDAVQPHDSSISQMNPSGKVPILIDGIHTVIDSVAMASLARYGRDLSRSSRRDRKRAASSSADDLPCDSKRAYEWYGSA